MASERIQRQIDRILGEAEEPSGQQDWELILEKARHILTFDPDNSEERAFLAVAERALAISSGPEASPPMLSQKSPQP